MTNPISKQALLGNIYRFRSYIEDGHPPDRLDGPFQIYRGLFNPQTGELKFAQKISSIEPRFKSFGSKGEVGDWEPVEIGVIRREDGRFEFDLKNLSAKTADVANRALEDTLLALGQIAIGSKDGKIRFDLSKLQLGLKETAFGHLPGWKGALDRIEAESRLQEASVGSYVLREAGDDTALMIEELGKSNHMRVRGLICTVVEEEDKISDLLFIQTDFGWTIMQDSQDLSDRNIYLYQKSLEELIKSLSSRLLYPI